jgi:predicted secreted hydrolase
VKNTLFLFTTAALIALLLSVCEPSHTSERRSDFAVLAQQVDGFSQAKPGIDLIFPADHGAHPDYRIEWWYLTANLTDAAGKPYGAQWTLFRVGVEPAPQQSLEKPSQNGQLFMAHMAITTPTDHLSFQRYAHGVANDPSSRAGVTALPFSAWLDDWSLNSTSTDWLPLEVHAKQGNDAFRLKLKSDLPPILQGDAGFSQKHVDGGGSYYYSHPFLKAEGELTLGGQTIPVSGDAWLDREWGSQFLQQDQVGWDWFSLHLKNGEKLMLFQLRQTPGANSAGHFIYGNLINKDGTNIRLDPKQISLTVMSETSINGRSLPMAWQIRLPQINRQMTIEALHTDQWMDVDFPYWEGVVNISGKGPENSGRGYMELTGYYKDTATSP